MRIKVCSSAIEPRVVLVGSKSDDTLLHQVIPSTVWNDPLCDCKGYLFRGRCSHVDHVEDDRCYWWTEDLSYTGICQSCGASLIEFTLEPEYD